MLIFVNTCNFADNEVNKKLLYAYF